MQAHISYKDYYDLNPSGGNSPGDIWHGLPSFGLLPFNPVSGIVITPACDLANSKAETITYLPVIPVIDWFRTIAFLPELRRIIDAQWKVLSAEPLLTWRPGYLVPEQTILKAAASCLEDQLKIGSLDTKSQIALERVKIGLARVANLRNGSSESIKMSNMEVLLGQSALKKLLESMATNSFRTDLHFLPKDNQPKEWSGVFAHSLVLFRYPITVPIDILNGAQDISLSDWPAMIASVKRAESNTPSTAAG